MNMMQLGHSKVNFKISIHLFNNLGTLTVQHRVSAVIMISLGTFATESRIFATDVEYPLGSITIGINATTKLCFE